MRLLTKSLLAAAVLAAAPTIASAESNYQTGAGALTATAHLDFQVTIPKVLYLRVGTGSNLANNTAIDLISFSVPAASVGNGTAVAATAASGDLGNGAVTARVIGNSGAVTLGATTAGALGNGAGDTISYGQINTAVATLTSTTALPAPALADGASSTVNVPAVANIVNRDARWTYTYANAAVMPAGTYGGVNTNNGRVTYTASAP